MPTKPERNPGPGPKLVVLQRPEQHAPGPNGMRVEHCAPTGKQPGTTGPGTMMLGGKNGLTGSTGGGTHGFSGGAMGEFVEHTMPPGTGRHVVGPNGKPRTFTIAAMGDETHCYPVSQSARCMVLPETWTDFVKHLKATLRLPTMNAAMRAGSGAVWRAYKQAVLAGVRGPSALKTAEAQARARLSIHEFASEDDISADQSDVIHADAVPAFPRLLSGTSLQVMRRGGRALH